MMNYEERRRFPRVKVNCAMSFKRVACGSQAHALCMDISVSGLMFEADEAVDPGRALEIRTFPADRMTPSLTALVEVVRCQEAGTGRYRVAAMIKGIKSQAPEPAAP